MLVAGGQHGQVKVIMPNKNVCISRFDAHSSQIKALLFHHNHPDILLSIFINFLNIYCIEVIYLKYCILKLLLMVLSIFGRLT